MKGTPERQHLEEALKDERAGSAKIRALADYATLKQVEYLESQHPLTEIMTLPERKLLARKVTIEWHIDKQVVSLNARDEVLSAEYHTIRASQGTKVPCLSSGPVRRITR